MLRSRAATLIVTAFSTFLLSAAGAQAAGAGAGGLRVLAVYPAGSGAIAGDAQFTIRFSERLAPTQRISPELAPKLAGRWRQAGPRTLEFVPASAYEPGAEVKLTVPAGLRAANGARLPHAVGRAYRVGQPSTLRLLQLLAGLGYLPVHFVGHAAPPAGSRRAQLQALFSPPSGSLVLGRGWPGTLRQLWDRQRSLVIQGAIMDFQSQHGLAMTGTFGTQLWSELLSATVSHDINRHGYTYAVASEASPETLTLYHNGAVVLRTLANTGIAVSPTALGTYPVYERLQSQVMRGINPNGVPYADPVQWVSYFNGGDAVHYMPRASYGYPQSLGCVELPYAAAERAWGFITYGTLVTVI